MRKVTSGWRRTTWAAARTSSSWPFVGLIRPRRPTTGRAGRGRGVTPICAGTRPGWATVTSTPGSVAAVARELATTRCGPQVATWRMSRTIGAGR